MNTPTDLESTLSRRPEPMPPYPGAVQDEMQWHLVKYLQPDAALRTEVEMEVAASAEWPESGHGPSFHTVDAVVEMPTSRYVCDDCGREPSTTVAGCNACASSSLTMVDATRRVAIEMAPSRTLRDHHRRLVRDARLLDAGLVDVIYRLRGSDVLHQITDVIYRLRGSDVLHQITDVIYLMSQWDAGLFTERGRINLETLANREARELTVRPEQPSALVAYSMPSDEAPERHLWHVANGQAPHILVRRLSAAHPSVWQPYADLPQR